MVKKGIALAGVAAVLLCGLTGCSKSPEQLAFEACKKYVEAGYASNDDPSEYCRETSKGSGKTTPDSVDIIRELIVNHNQKSPANEQIEVNF